MYLYHGSNLAVTKPKIINSKRSLDFGNAFYLTTDIEQAKRWTKIISVFEFKKLM